MYWNLLAAYTGEILAGIAGGLLIVSLAVALSAYRNWRYEQELDSLLWKISFKDIEIKETKPHLHSLYEPLGKTNFKVKINDKKSAFVIFFFDSSKNWLHCSGGNESSFSQLKSWRWLSLLHYIHRSWRL